jgi:hypothetical protein
MYFVRARRLFSPCNFLVAQGINWFRTFFSLSRRSLIGFCVTAMECQAMCTMSLTS